MDEQIPTFPPPAEFAAQAVAGADLYEEAAEDRLAYWARRAREILHWEQDFTDVLDWSDAPFAKWFVGGTTNA
ncbi:acetyl-coenzyme A synthetase, partial [Xanthomonas citri pv. citri]|nr:acetyl-coenzyme A synthetase [Xanthomonas citri pv. citri]